jgi:hypothetical protein
MGCCGGKLATNRLSYGITFGTRVELASWLRLSVSMLNTIVKNHEERERSYTQCEPSSKNWKSLNCLLLEKLVPSLTAWLKQAR